MRYAYVLILTMLLAGVAVPDSYGQGRGRGETSDSRTVDRDDDDRVTEERSGRTRGSTGGVESRRDRDDEYETRSRRRSDSRRDRDDDDWDDDWDWDDDDWGDDDYYDRDRKGNGPPFCENGNGHPVHGWEWCEEKGYGDRRIRWPGDRDRRDRRWEDRSWEDIIFGDGRRDRDGRRRDYDYERWMDRGILVEDILGDRIYRRFDDYRRSQGLQDAIVGYWVRPDNSRSRMMRLYAGDTPLALLADSNGDGRVDVVKVIRLR